MSSSRNQFKRIYSDEEKARYYARKASKAASTTRVSGSGRYRIGRQYVRGRGAYRIPRNFFSAPKVGQLLGSAGGAALGNLIAPGIGGKMGASLGSEVGQSMGNLFKSITGWGDYQVKENSLLFPSKIVPSFGEDSIRVKKREYITDIDATTAFTNNTFPINPGLSETFPWLSAIAQNYEQYRFNGLIFQFVSTSSDAIASSTDLGLGQVILATDYNAADDPFVNSPQMLGSMFSNSAKPSENILHAIECAPTDQAQKLYYVRTGDPPEATDIRLYDLGVFQIATDKMQSNYDGLGQLWVSYDITFCKSVQNNQLGFSLNTDKYVIGGTIAQATPLGTVQTLAEHSNLGTTINDTVVSFPPALSSGYYMFTYQVSGPNAATTMDAMGIGVTNCTLVQAFKNNAATIVDNTGMSAGAAVLILMVQFIVRIDSRDASVEFEGNGVLPGSPTSCDLLITQINGEIFA